SFSSMESSEECSSSESGWTKYLASPIHDDDDDEGGDDDDGYGHEDGGVEDHGSRKRSKNDSDDDKDDNDDDSMASDASSGPSSYIGHGEGSKPKNERGGGKNQKVEAKKEERRTKGSKDSK
ncbi:uncharacterized protein A4U43_C05F22650, partial [Asparagus officinalis]